MKRRRDMKSGFKNLSRGEWIALMFGLMLCFGVYGNAVYQVYLSNIEHTVTFKVFDAWAYQNKGMDETQILTWGNSTYSKYQFIGNWTGQMFLDHSYTVTYVQERGSQGHPWNRLIVLKWEEI